MKHVNTARWGIAIVAGILVGLYLGAMAFAHGSVESLWLEYLKDAALIFSFGTLLNLLASDNRWPALCVGMPLIGVSIFIFFGNVGYGMTGSLVQLSGFRLFVNSAGLLLAILLTKLIEKRIAVGAIGKVANP